MGEMQFTGTQEEWEAFVLLNKHNNMAQTSVEFIVYELSAIIGPLKTNPMTDLLIVDAMKKAMEMHKVDCLSFAEQWEARCNEKDMDSKEQLYNEIYNK